MKYQILRGVLIAGVVLGFGSGFAHVGARWAMHRSGHHPHWGQHCRDKATPDVKTEAKLNVKPQATIDTRTAARPTPLAASTPAPMAFPTLAPAAPAVL